MTTPNWQHHSNKEKKRHLKPQALRQARARRSALLKKLASMAESVDASDLKSADHYGRGSSSLPTRIRVK
tara:strand:+ start:2880 stop:3089 length:210 start_codon:yes stop_codon:yes gene_type:complete